MLKKKKITVAVSGFWNPLHIGHLNLFEHAKSMGDKLVVIVKNDKQVERKGSIPFMPEGERKRIIESLAVVNYAVISKDNDGTACKSIEMVKPDIYCGGSNGTHPDDIQEKKVCDRLGVKMVFNCGGKKIRNSSEIIQAVQHHI